MLLHRGNQRRQVADVEARQRRHRARVRAPGRAGQTRGREVSQGVLLRAREHRARHEGADRGHRRGSHEEPAQRHAQRRAAVRRPEPREGVDEGQRANPCRRLQREREPHAAAEREADHVRGFWKSVEEERFQGRRHPSDRQPPARQRGPAVPGQVDEEHAVVRGHRRHLLAPVVGG